MTPGRRTTAPPDGRPAPDVRSTIVLAGILVAACGMGLTACGGGAAAEGQQACAHVETSLHLYADATADLRAGRTTRATQEQAEALSQLRLALPLAARASNADGQWQPLEATLSESNRVPEANLVMALNAQCQGVGPG